MIKRLICALLIVIGVGAISAFADHLPEHLQAHGTPETILGRINLKNTTIEKIIRLYGKPTEEKKEDPSLPNSYGSIDYYWRRTGLTLHVQIHFLPNDPTLTRIVLVEVGERTSRKASQTGSGLKLGDTLSDLKRIYGQRVHLRNIPNRNIHDVTIQWRQEEYSLVANLDAKNRITSLSLFAPE